jgi:23S rRNA (guanine745-N1)-methyltransferase
VDIKRTKKIDRARGLVKTKQYLFKCPICSGQMFIDDHKSLACHNNHSFDFSKKGYLNLLTAANSPSYSRELFAARHQVCLAGFYDPLIDKLIEIINAHFPDNKAVLDAGCGEGSHIYDIYRKTQEKSDNVFAGADISKDSINIAASNNADIIWCVADLAKLPFLDKTFDIVLNILSPANYSEFQRILHDEGRIIKVVPGPQYLRELRGIIYQGEKTVDYSNREVVKYFRHKLNLVDTYDIQYEFAVHDELWPHLIKMTPLIWGSSEEKLIDILNTKVPQITVDLMILTGMKKLLD